MPLAYNLPFQCAPLIQGKIETWFGIVKSVFYLLVQAVSVILLAKCFSLSLKKETCLKLDIWMEGLFGLNIRYFMKSLQGLDVFIHGILSSIGRIQCSIAE